jgi:SAM-dependent methyltransferase
MGLPDKCPLCKAGREVQGVVTAHVFGSPHDRHHAFFHCGACDVRYLYPGLTPEEEVRFYAAEFEGFMASRSGQAGGWHRAEEHIAANEPTRLRRMKYLEPHLEQARYVLEIGCSSGFMLLPLVAAGKDCIGVEPSGIFSEFVRSRGLSVYPSLDALTGEDAECRFDVILHFFVLEHISKPLEFLQAQLDLLRPGGKLVFEVPNVADPLCSVYDIPNFERFYWSIAHPWYFSEASLSFLLDRLGCAYEILRDQRYDLSNHMVWARDGRPGGKGRFTDALGADVEEAYKQALIRSGRCDTLIGVISKV